jgi:hypothetical protein
MGVSRAGGGDIYKPEFCCASFGICFDILDWSECDTVPLLSKMPSG